MVICGRQRYSAAVILREGLKDELEFWIGGILRTIPALLLSEPYTLLPIGLFEIGESNVI
jgi:hypothetical protein